MKNKTLLQKVSCKILPATITFPTSLTNSIFFLLLAPLNGYSSPFGLKYLDSVTGPGHIPGPRKNLVSRGCGGVAQW
jgi:hypothetical protein